MRDSRHGCDVAIVGGGLAGATLAAALRRWPLSVAVLDPGRGEGGGGGDGRSLALSYGSARLYRTLGLWEEIGREAAPIREVHVSRRGRLGFTRIRAGECGVDALGYVVPARSLQGRLNEGKEWVRELIPSAVDIVDLHGCFSRAIPNYSYDAVSFDRAGNDHWNETGNMVAAHCLYRLLEEEAGLPSLSDDALAEARYEYYRAIGGSDDWMPSSPWAKRPPTMRHDPAAIAAKYLALESEPGERPLQLVSRAEALANSSWLIYLVRAPAAQDSLVYFKMRCSEEDKARGFLLQVDAANPADLPLERQAFGYEDLDFDFEGNGVDSGRRLYWHGAVQLLPGACMVTASLPAYEIAAVRTGQYSDSGEARHAWMVEFTADEMFPRNREK